MFFYLFLFIVSPTDHCQESLILRPFHRFSSVSSGLFHLPGAVPPRSRCRRSAKGCRLREPWERWDGRQKGSQRSCHREKPSRFFKTDVVESAPKPWLLVVMLSACGKVLMSLYDAFYAPGRYDGWKINLFVTLGSESHAVQLSSTRVHFRDKWEYEYLKGVHNYHYRNWIKWRTCAMQVRFFTADLEPFLFILVKSNLFCTCHLPLGTDPRHSPSTRKIMIFSKWHCHQKKPPKIGTLPETNSLKIGHPKRKRKSLPTIHFLGAFAVSFREGKCLPLFQSTCRIW